MVLAAWAIALAQTSVNTVSMKATHYGYRSKDVPSFSVKERVYHSKLGFATGLLYNPVLGLVKWAIILFLLRLGDQRPQIRWTLYFLLAFNISHMLSVFLVVCFQCTPAHMFWNHHYTDRLVNGIPVNDNYTCIDQAVFSLSTAAIAVLTDIAILLVPVAMMWNLRMPARKKAAVIFVLSLGWVIAVVGLIRIKYFVDMWYGYFPDPNYSLWQTLSGIENSVAIIVACGPALKTLITHFSPRFFGSTMAGWTERTPRNTTGGITRTTDVDLSSLPRQHRAKGDSTEAIVRSESFGGDPKDW